MHKGLFFNIPAFSVHKTLNPIIVELNSSDYRIISYNSPEFASEEQGGEFKAYPPYEGGYRTTSIRRQISYFEFAEMLLDTGLSLQHFLRTEMEREQPDFILHTHLSPWGKALARCCGLPGVTLQSTCVFDPRIMLPFYRTQREEGSRVRGDMRQFVRCQRKYRMLYEAFGGKCERPDIWDAYMSREGLNVVCMLKALQEQSEILGPEYRFVGHPNSVVPHRGGRDLIYMAQGSILTDDLELLRLGVGAFGRLRQPCLMALGHTLQAEALGPIPDHVTVAPFVDQQEVLGRTAVFITMGGMVSVHEAISAETPMIIIPETPEQHLTARRLERRGIATYIQRKDVTGERLWEAITQMLRERDACVERIRELKREGPSDAPARLARMCIDEYLDGDERAAGSTTSGIQTAAAVRQVP